MKNINFENLLKLTFKEIEQYCDFQKNISLESILYTTKESLEKLKTGLLKLIIKRLTANNGVFKVEIVFLADRGQYILRYWDDSSKIIIREGVTGVFKIDVAKESSVVIGQDSTSNGIHIIAINSDIEIGNDCMFSDGILLQATDQHGIVDIKKQKIINNYRRYIKILDHVWIARNATIMPDITIGEGSIVATGGLVTKNIPKFSIAAGVPAKIVKTDMTWSRFTNNFDNYSKKIIKEVTDD